MGAGPRAHSGRGPERGAPYGVWRSMRGEPSAFRVTPPPTPHPPSSSSPLTPRAEHRAPPIDLVRIDEARRAAGARAAGAAVCVQVLDERAALAAGVAVV